MKKRITLKPLFAKISKSARKAVLLFLPILFIASLAWAQAPLISMLNGNIKYNKYANQGETSLVNQIPDFSGVGYRGGGVAIPTLAVKKTVQAIQGDCRALIQTAIDEVSALPLDANGFRGAVLLKAGVYPVDSSLFIRASGVVLRGEGNGVTGTVLIATDTVQHDLVNIKGTTSGGEVASTRVRVSTAYVPTGSKTFSVATNNFQVGDMVVVQKTPTQNWIDRMDMAQYGWTITGYRLSFERKVVAVSGNSITLDLPMVDPIDNAYGGADVYKKNIVGRVQECGIENMRIESYFAANDDEKHGWYAVETSGAENCWVKDVVAKYFGNGSVNISTGSIFITVQDCVMADPKSITTGGRKYSFNIEYGATAVLFQRCMSWGGRHDFVTGGTVPGPNAFLDCVVQNGNTDSGPHHRYSTGQLYDNFYGQSLAVYNRGASGTGHGWAGAQILFYNCESTEFGIKVSSPPGARNWAIGCKGVAQSGDGYWESWGTNILPRSLYLQQLQERKGLAAVQNIATTQQLNDYVGMRNTMVTRVNAIKNEARVVAPTIPAAPSNLVATANSATQVTVTWNDNSTNETKFYLQQSTNGTTFVTLANPPANADGTASFTVTGLTASTHYWFRVRAENTAGVSVYSNINDATTSSVSLVDLTDNGGVITAQYANTVKPSENFPALIDNLTSTKYYISGQTNLWVQYKSSIPAIVIKYNVVSANDAADRDPKNWQLLGSNDGTSWTTLDSRSGELFANRFLSKSYSISNTTPYLYYQLKITAVNGGTGTQFAEWELISSPSYYNIKVVNNPTFSLHAASATPVNGTNVNLYSGSFGATQEWQLLDTDNGYKRIVSKTNPNYVLECANTSANGVNVQLGTWAGNSNTRQQWLFTDIGSGAYKITVRENASFGLECASTPANNINAQVWNYSGNNRQQWILEPVSVGSGMASGKTGNNKVVLQNIDDETSSELTLTYSADGFNGKVHYNLPEASQTKIVVYNLNGNKVADLFSGFSKSGEHQASFNTLSIAKGVYVIGLTSGSKAKTVKVMIN